MFVILAYDVNAKRVAKTLKICRRYLLRVQNSLFEGELTEGQLKRLKAELEKAVRPEQDSVQIYVLQSGRYIRRDQLGVMKNDSNIIE